MSILRVALDLPLPQLFDYRCADATDTDIGMRVLVPFGKRQALGVIVDITDRSDVDNDKLKSAVRILRETAALGRDWLDLARF
jgi:primosomal protein N' (replication factor Y)